MPLRAAHDPFGKAKWRYTGDCLVALGKLAPTVKSWYPRADIVSARRLGSALMPPGSRLENTWTLVSGGILAEMSSSTCVVVVPSELRCRGLASTYAVSSPNPCQVAGLAKLSSCDTASIISGETAASSVCRNWKESCKRGAIAPNPLSTAFAANKQRPYCALKGSKAALCSGESSAFSAIRSHAAFGLSSASR